MAFVLTLPGLFGVAAGAFAFAATLVVLTLGGPRFQKWALAGLFFAEAVACALPTGVIYLTDEPATVYAAQLTGDLAVVAFPFVMLLFASTLPTPLVRPIAMPAVRAALCVALVASLVLVVARPELFVTGVRTADYAPYDAVGGPGFFVAFFAAAVVSLFILVATLHAARRARGTAMAPRMRWWAIAFGTREVAFVALVSLSLTEAIPWLGAFAPGILIFTYLPLVVYAVLKTQLFDIDLHIKWTIRRGTLIAILAVAFVVVAETAQNWLSDAYGYVAGGLAAGALLLAIRPLDRAAGRVADAAMPRVQETPAYIAYRKMEVYRAALEGAREDGAVTDKERAMLRRLRESLGIADADAHAMERDLAGGHPSGSG